MKKRANLRLVPIYILTIALFLTIGSSTVIALIVSKVDLKVLYWYIPFVAVICIAFAIWILYYLRRLKNRYDKVFDEILTAFPSEKTDALMTLNDGEPTPEQISRWICEQTESSDKASYLMALISAQNDLSNEIFWHITDSTSQIFFGGYWSHVYGYNDLDKSNNIRNLLSEDTKVDFDRALKNLKEGISKSFNITGSLNLSPQKSVKVTIKGSQVEDSEHKSTIVGCVHDIQDEVELNRIYQAEKIKKNFLLNAENDVIYEVNVPENSLVCLTPATAKELFGFGSMMDFDGERRPFWDRIHPDYREGFVDRFFDYNHMMIMPDHKMTYEYKIKNREGDYIWVEHQAQVTSTYRGTVLEVIGRIKNINEQKGDELRSRYQTTSDSLTGAYLRSAVEAEFNDSMANGNQKAIVLFNINKFHFINNEYGFEYGDKVLKHFVSVLWDRQKGSCIVGRVESDLFIVAMLDAGIKTHFPSNQIEYVFDAFSQPIKIGGKLINLSITAGGSQVSDKLDFNKLYEQAEAALIKCRNNTGKYENAYEIYE